MHQRETPGATRRKGASAGAAADRGVSGVCRADRCRTAAGRACCGRAGANGRAVETDLTAADLGDGLLIGNSLRELLRAKLAVPA